MRPFAVLLHNITNRIKETEENFIKKNEKVTYISTNYNVILILI